MPEQPKKDAIVTSSRGQGDANMASVRGEIDLHSSPELRDALLGAINTHKPRKVILNLAQVSYMDSSAVAVLVESLQKLRKAGGKMCLTNLQPRVKGLLEIARLDTIFVIADNEEEALKK